MKKNLKTKLLATILTFILVISQFYGLEFGMLEVIAENTIVESNVIDGMRTYELTDESGAYIGVKYTIDTETVSSCIYGERMTAVMQFYYEQNVDEDKINDAFIKHRDTEKIWGNWYDAEGRKISVYSISFNAADNVEYIIPNKMCYGWAYTGWYYNADWSLQYVTLQEGITVIGEEAFASCFGLKSINGNDGEAIFPKSLKEIKASAFRYALQGTSYIEFPEAEHDLFIGTYNFYNNGGRDIYFYNPNCVISDIVLAYHNYSNNTFYGYSVNIKKGDITEKYISVFDYAKEKNIKFVNLESLKGEGEEDKFSGKKEIYVDEYTKIKYSLHSDATKLNEVQLNEENQNSTYKKQELIKAGEIEWRVIDRISEEVATIESIEEITFTNSNGIQYIDSVIIGVRGVSAGDAVLIANYNNKDIDEYEFNVSEKIDEESVSWQIFSGVDAVMDKLGNFKVVPAIFNIQKIGEKEIGDGNTMKIWSIGCDSDSIKNIKTFFDDSDEYIWLLTKYNDFRGDSLGNSRRVDVHDWDTQRILRRLKTEKKGFFKPQDSDYSGQIGASAIMYSVTNQYGKVIDYAGGILVEASGVFEFTRYFYTPVGIPVFVKLEFGAQGEVLFPPHDFVPGGTSFDDNKGHFQLTGFITPELAVGVEGAMSAGVYGNVKLPIEVPFRNPLDFGLYYEGALGIHLQALYMFELEVPLIQTKEPIRLWPRKDEDEISLNSLEQISDENFSLINVENLSNAQTEWNVNNSDSLDSNQNSKENLLLDNVLGSALPMQAQIDGKSVMIFQSYNPNSESVVNACSLMYSVKDQGTNTWSKPEYVFNNGKSDYYADMKVVNGKLVLTWMKSDPNKNFSDQNVLSDITGSVEIYMSIFDETINRFGTPIRVTKNTTIDMMPQIVNDDDKIAISWISNNQNSISLNEGSNSIYAVEYNQETGTIGKEIKLVDVVGTVENYITHYDNNKLKAIYTGTQNGYMGVYDTDGLSINALSNIVKDVDTEGSIGNMSYINGNIEFIVEGNVYRYNIENGQVEQVNVESASVGSNVQYVSNGTTNAYVWSSYNNDTQMNEIVVSIENENGYNERVTLYESEDEICRYMSPVLDSEGNWNIIANVQKADGTNKIVSITQKNKTQISVNSVGINEKVKNEAGESLVWIDVNNVGDSVVEKIYVSIEKDGVKDVKEINTNLAVASSDMYKTYFDFEDVNEATPIVVSVYTSEEDVQNFSHILGMTNIIVDSTVKNTSVNTATITAKLINSGDMACDVSVDLFGVIDACEPLESNTIEIGKGETKEVTFVVDKENIEYNEEGEAYYKVCATSSIAETDYTDNTSHVTVNIGSVVIDGFQINPSLGVRTIYSTNYDETDVSEVGIIYGFSKTGIVDEEEMILNSSSSSVYAFKGTEAGITDTQYTKLSNGRNYLMTLKFGNTNIAAYSAKYYVRAYVKLSDGSTVYSNVKSYSAYEVAKAVYETGKVSNKNNFNMLYKIITTVDPTYEELDYDWVNTVITKDESNTSDNVEVTGYSISTTVQINDSIPGGIRMYYSTKYDDDEIERLGLVMANTEVSEDDMVLNTSNSNVRVIEATSEGKSTFCYSSWGEGQTYVMTMLFGQYVSQLMTEPFTIRAFVELKDGTVEYSELSTFTIFDVAKYIYTNSMTSKEDYHNFIFDNILTLVEPAFEKVEFDWSNILIN